MQRIHFLTLCKWFAMEHCGIVLPACVVGYCVMLSSNDRVCHCNVWFGMVKYLVDRTVHFHFPNSQGYCNIIADNDTLVGVCTWICLSVEQNLSTCNVCMMVTDHSFEFLARSPRQWCVFNSSNYVVRCITWVCPLSMICTVFPTWLKCSVNCIVSTDLPWWDPTIRLSSCLGDHANGGVCGHGGIWSIVSSVRIFTWTLVLFPVSSFLKLSPINIDTKPILSLLVWSNYISWLLAIWPILMHLLHNKDMSIHARSHIAAEQIPILT